MLGFEALGRLALGEIPQGDQTVTLVAASGAYNVSGLAAWSTNFLVEPAGSYVLTGNVAFQIDAYQSASGSYSITGNDAGQTFGSESGSYAVTGNAVLFTTTLLAEAGSYTLTLGEYELRRTGDDIEPGIYGLGHIKLAMEEARRLSRVVKPTPYPIVSRLPRLAPLPAQVHTPLPVGGLIDNNDLLDHLVAQRQQMAAQQAQEARQQARNRAMAVLLLAA